MTIHHQLYIYIVFMRLVRVGIIALTGIEVISAARKGPKGHRYSVRNPVKTAETTTVAPVTAGEVDDAATIGVPESSFGKLVGAGKTSLVATRDFIRAHKVAIGAVGAIAVGAAAAMAAPMISEIHSELTAYAALDTARLAFLKAYSAKAKLCGLLHMHSSYGERIRELPENPAACLETSPEVQLLQQLSNEAYSVAEEIVKGNPGTWSHAALYTYVQEGSWPIIRDVIMRRLR